MFSDTAVQQNPGIDVNPLLGRLRASRPCIPRPPTIIDEVIDLLNLLDPCRRRGMIAWLAVRYYDGYRPGRAEIADLVAVELGTLTFDESISRQHARDRGEDRIADITPYIKQHRLQHSLTRT